MIIKAIVNTPVHTQTITIAEISTNQSILKMKFTTMYEAAPLINKVRKIVLRNKIKNSNQNNEFADKTW